MRFSESRLVDSENRMQLATNHMKLVTKQRHKLHAISNKTTQQAPRKVAVWMVHNVGHGGTFCSCSFFLKDGTELSNAFPLVITLR